MKLYLLIILSNVLFLFSQSLSCNDLVYHPQNSAFGGSPAATQVLLSKASAQNLTTDPNKKDRQQKTQIERFEEQLERSILRKLSNTITDSFNEDSEDLTGKIFNTDEFSINILTDNAESMELQIENFTDGTVTTLTIPKI